MLHALASRATSLCLVFSFMLSGDVSLADCSLSGTGTDTVSMEKTVRLAKRKDTSED